MTPAARAAAAIGVLDTILAGQPAEQALTNWGRANRYAGSSDRAALRDLVFDALRCRRSFAALGGAMTGRGLILGGLRAAGLDPAAVFADDRYAPPPPDAADAPRAPEGDEALDVPDWLAPRLKDSLGPDYTPVMQAMRQRAPVFLRVNPLRATRAAAIAALAADGVEARPHPLAAGALEVLGGARRIQQGAAYLDGLVELQDASSQAVVEALPLRDGQRVLDLCAGGGGKTLAMAGRARVALFAHDADPRRMRDLPARAARAGAAVKITEKPEKTGPYDLILTDVPCSGSGSWRRDPEGKWRLTAARLDELLAIQSGVMDRAAGMLRAGGVLAYATCSLLRDENGAQVAAFLARNAGWHCTAQHRLTPLTGGDGFFLALLARG
ncbi:MAG: hypothetical protein RIR62_2870 [Pseudomonadota bacterium]